MREYRADKAHSGGVDPYNAWQSSFRDLKAQEQVSRLTWGDGPRRRYRGSSETNLITPGYRIWQGWPTDELTICYKRLLAAILSIERREDG